MQGVLNRATFDRMAQLCLRAKPEQGKRGTSFIQFRLNRLLEAGYVYQDPENKGKTGSYQLTQAGVDFINKAYGVSAVKDAYLPIVRD